VQAEKKKRQAQYSAAVKRKEAERTERKMAAVARERAWAERLIELKTTWGRKEGCGGLRSYSRNGKASNLFLPLCFIHSFQIGCLHSVKQFQDFCGRIAVPFCSTVVLNAETTFSMNFINPFCCNGASARCVYNKGYVFRCVPNTWNGHPLLFWYINGTELQIKPGMTMLCHPLPGSMLTSDLRILDILMIIAILEN
jgi:hypothetical protein